MATKAELEAEVESLTKALSKAEKKAEKVTEKVVEVETVVEIPAPLAVPPVESGTMYVESHPILGVTRTARVTGQSNGDGRIGDGAVIVRE